MGCCQSVEAGDRESGAKGNSRTRKKQGSGSAKAGPGAEEARSTHLDGAAGAQALKTSGASSSLVPVPLGTQGAPGLAGTELGGGAFAGASGAGGLEGDGRASFRNGGGGRAENGLLPTGTPYSGAAPDASGSSSGMQQWGAKPGKGQLVPPAKNSTGCIEMLAFEVASVVVRAINLRQSLLERDIEDLRQEVLASEGIRMLVSDDFDTVWAIAAEDKRGELRQVARDVARRGLQCTPGSPLTRLHERFDGLGTPGGYKARLTSSEAEAELKVLESQAQVTADLYHELTSLDNMQHALNRKLLDEPSSSNKDLVVQMRAELKAQEKMVKMMKRQGLWSRRLDEVVDRLAEIVVFLHDQIVDIFGADVVQLGGLMSAGLGSTLSSTDRIAPKVATAQDSEDQDSSSSRRLGATGMALQYANVINMIDALVMRPSVVDHKRDELFAALPASIRGRLKRTLLLSGDIEQESTDSIRQKMEGVLDWLVTMAENTVRYGLDLRMQGYTDLTLLQTLHHVEEQRMENLVLLLLVGLQHLVSRAEDGTEMQLFPPVPRMPTLAPLAALAAPSLASAAGEAAASSVPTHPPQQSAAPAPTPAPADAAAAAAAAAAAEAAAAPAAAGVQVRAEGPASGRGKDAEAEIGQESRLGAPVTPLPPSGPPAAGPAAELPLKEELKALAAVDGIGDAKDDGAARMLNGRDAQQPNDVAAAPNAYTDPDARWQGGGGGLQAEMAADVGTGRLAGGEDQDTMEDLLGKAVKPSRPKVENSALLGSPASARVGRGAEASVGGEWLRAMAKSQGFSKAKIDFIKGLRDDLDSPSDNAQLPQAVKDAIRGKARSQAFSKVSATEGLDGTPRASHSKAMSRALLAALAEADESEGVPRVRPMTPSSIIDVDRLGDFRIRVPPPTGTVQDVQERLLRKSSGGLS